MANRPCAAVCPAAAVPQWRRLWQGFQEVHSRTPQVAACGHRLTSHLGVISQNLAWSTLRPSRLVEHDGVPRAHATQEGATARIMLGRWAEQARQRVDSPPQVIVQGDEGRAFFIIHAGEASHRDRIPATSRRACLEARPRWRRSCRGSHRGKCIAFYETMPAGPPAERLIVRDRLPTTDD